MKNSQGRTFGRALERRYKTEKGKQGSKKPDACIEGERHKHDRAATSDLQDGACTAPFLFGEFGDACDVARFFCDLQAIECRAASGSLFDTADIPGKFSNPPARSTLCPRWGRQTGLPHHAAEIACEFVTKASGLARGFHKRKSGARRRSRAKGYIGASGDRDSGRRQTQHQFVRFLPRPYRVPSRKASRISPNTNRSPSVVPASAAMSSGSPVINRAQNFSLCAAWSRLRRSRFNLFRQRRIERHMPLARKIDEALGEFGIVGGQRGFDFALATTASNLPSSAWSAMRRDHRGRHRVRRARHGIGRSRSEQASREQGGPDARRAQPFCFDSSNSSLPSSARRRSAGQPRRFSGGIHIFAIELGIARPPRYGAAGNLPPARGNMRNFHGGTCRPPLPQ